MPTRPTQETITVKVVEVSVLQTVSITLRPCLSARISLRVCASDEAFVRRHPERISRFKLIKK